MKLNRKKYSLMQWYVQAGNITTYMKVNIYITLPDLSAKKIVMWNYHVDNSAKVGYDIILGRDISLSLGLNPKWSEHVI